MKILDYLREHIVLLDGGMGTLLQSAGLGNDLPERWNLTHPDTVTEIHRAYFEAGSNIVATNTFGANPLKYGKDELTAVIRAAVENAKRARETSTGTQEKYIALDVGPLGRMLKPYGDLDFEDAVAAFAETVKIGAACGVDLVVAETLNDSYETKAALLAIKENCDLPVFVSNAYSADGKLMTGASPEAMVALLEGMGADAVGMNCSLGPDQLAPIAEAYLKAASIPVLLKPNAGLPRVDADGKTVYDVTPDEFATAVAKLVGKGVRLVGGCCGTTPAYIKALAAAIAGMTPTFIVPKEKTVVSSYTHVVEFGASPVLIGERINPTGKKRFRQAIVDGDFDYLLGEGLRQEERGAQVLDVNVGVPGIDERATLTRAVEELQAVVDLPLQIDTSSPEAMAAALRRYNGKALVNSVNGKRESMDAIFPLVKKYGGVVIALTLDEDGIPETADGRIRVAKKILAEAQKYGIPKHEIVFDPLAMAVSAAPRAAAVTLESLQRIRTELGCYTSLGVSNISFGLPNRDTVNGAFFAMAMERGLSAAIMNPDSAVMMQTWYSFRALRGLDENCADYIRLSGALTAEKSENAPSMPASAAPERLRDAVVKGLKDRAAALCLAALETRAPLDLVQEEIIPALDEVGRGFEEKKIYLPGLLMSAEAAKSAFEQIKVRMSVEGSGKPTASKGKFVLATVHGDIHDIGKNIVHLLMENYGFEVIDLGKDVPPEKIVEAAIEHHAPLVGLSALMTTTVPAMAETVKQLRKGAPWCKVIVGGAVLNSDYAASIGADAYAKDAMGAVRYAETVCK